MRRTNTNGGGVSFCCARRHRRPGDKESATVTNSGIVNDDDAQITSAIAATTKEFTPMKSYASGEPQQSVVDTLRLLLLPPW
jgi:hypothetical protein